MGKRSLLIVATDTYDDPGLSALRGPSADAEALAAVLGDPEIGGFDVRTVLNQPAHLIAEVLEEFFSDRKPDDLLVVHISGHGIKNQSGELHFAGTNTKLRLLGATSVPANFVNRQMTLSRSRRIVLFLDCCYAGAFDRGMATRAGSEVDVGDRFSGHGRAVLTASGALEYAFDGEHLSGSAQPSVFTTAMVRGLRTGDADRNQDGWIGLDELYDYVYDAVREATPHQTPGKWTFDVRGDLHLARSSKQALTGPVPAAAAPPAEAPPAAAPRALLRAGSGRPPRVIAIATAVTALALIWLIWWQPWQESPQGIAAIPSAFAGKWTGPAHMPSEGVDLVWRVTFVPGAISAQISAGETGCADGTLLLTGGSETTMRMQFEAREPRCTSGTATVRLRGDDRLHLEITPDPSADPPEAPYDGVLTRESE